MNKFQNILIIKTDAIGDYILFQNILNQLKNNSNTPIKVTLLGNEIWKELALDWNKEHVSKFIWINIRKYELSRLYRVFLFLRLKSYRYDLAICAVRSRRYFFEDQFIKWSNAKVKIGNRTAVNLKGERYYNRIEEVEENFDFYWARSYFKRFVDFVRPFDLLTKINSSQSNNGSILLFVGASEIHKIWDFNNFANIALYIIVKYGKTVFLCGSKNEINIANRIMSKVGSNQLLIDKTGQTSFADLISLVNESSLIISNDSMGVHLAAILNKKVICVYKGDHYGRFLPYPSQYTNVNAIMPHKLTLLQENDRLLKFGNGMSDILIDEVEIEQVLPVVDKLIS